MNGRCDYAEPEWACEKPEGHEGDHTMWVGPAEVRAENSRPVTLGAPVTTETPMPLLSEDDLGLLKSLVRQEIRKNHRNYASGEAKWGAEFDPARILERRIYLEGLYERLGGDPANITVEASGG